MRLDLFEGLFLAWAFVATLAALGLWCALQVFTADRRRDAERARLVHTWRYEAGPATPPGPAKTGGET